MNSSKIEIKKTPKYGNSLFAKQDIKKDELIVDLSSGKIYTANKCSELPNDPPLFVRDHAIQFEENKWIDDELGRNLNHSCEPNCGFDGKFKIVAMRDIKKGEESTIDYEMMEDSNWQMRDCVCEAVTCRKKIGSFKNMPNNVRKKYGKYLSLWVREKYELFL